MKLLRSVCNFCMHAHSSRARHSNSESMCSVSSVQFSHSIVSESLRPPVHHQLPEFTQTHVHRVGDAIQPSHPLSSPSSPAPIPPSIRVFSNESTLHMRWPQYWSFSFSISPSNEHPGLISFRMDWLDLLAVQGTVKSLLQHCYNPPKKLENCSRIFNAMIKCEIHITK